MNHYDPRLILPTQQTATPPYVFYKNVFSAPECAAIIAAAERSEMPFGTIGNGGNDGSIENLEYRTARTVALNWWTKSVDNKHNFRFMYDRVRNNVELVNRDFYRFDLHGLHEELGVMKYDPPMGDIPAGHYDQHQDFGGGMSSLRKLSIVVQLSEPTAYDGCRLELIADKKFDPGYVDQGDMLIFPSWTPHLVTPITRGRRYSLVGWITGPQFR